MFIFEDKELMRSFYREAFDRVTSDTDIKKEILERIYNETCELFVNGSSARCNIFKDLLSEVAFKWKSYSIFLKFFKKINIEPMQWRFQYSGLAKGISAKYIIKIFGKEHLIEIAKFFAEHGAAFKRMKDAAAFLEATIIDKKTMRIFLQKAREYDIDEEISYWNQDRRDAKAYLLCNTVMHSAYTLMHLHSFGVPIGDITPERYKLWPGCDAAKYFVTLWKEGAIKGFPPFFPGDTTRISAKVYRDFLEEGVDPY